MHWSNGHLDESEAKEYTVRVIDRYRVGRNNTTYYISVPYWRDGKRSVNIRLSLNEYNLLQMGDYMDIQVKDGYWGYEWIKAFEKREFN